MRWAVCSKRADLKIGIIVAVFVAGIAALIAFSTMGGSRYRVEVCMFFGGRMNCKIVSGKSESSALRGAVQNACADIASGVEETMGCESSQPRSVRWLQRPSDQK